MNIIDKLLDDPTDASFDLEPLIHRSMKGKLPELELAIDGLITPAQAGKIKVIKQHYEDLESRKAELESIIYYPFPCRVLLRRNSIDFDCSVHEKPVLRHCCGFRDWCKYGRVPDSQTFVFLGSHE